jgi:hypothetical protein
LSAILSTIVLTKAEAPKAFGATAEAAVAQAEAFPFTPSQTVTSPVTPIALAF